VTSHPPVSTAVAPSDDASWRDSTLSENCEFDRVGVLERTIEELQHALSLKTKSFAELQESYKDVCAQLLMERERVVDRSETDQLQAAITHLQTSLVAKDRDLANLQTAMNERKLFEKHAANSLPERLYAVQNRLQTRLVAALCAVIQKAETLPHSGSAKVTTTDLTQILQELPTSSPLKDKFIMNRIYAIDDAPPVHYCSDAPEGTMGALFGAEYTPLRDNFLECLRAIGLRRSHDYMVCDRTCAARGFVCGRNQGMTMEEHLAEYHSSSSIVSSPTMDIIIDMLTHFASNVFPYRRGPWYRPWEDSVAPVWAAHIPQSYVMALHLFTLDLEFAPDMTSVALDMQIQRKDDPTVQSRFTHYQELAWYLQEAMRYIEQEAPTLFQCGAETFRGLRGGVIGKNVFSLSPSVTSTTCSRDMVKQIVTATHNEKVLLVIRGARGVRMDVFSDNPAEREILLYSNSIFQITERMCSQEKDLYEERYHTDLSKTDVFVMNCVTPRDRREWLARQSRDRTNSVMHLHAVLSNACATEDEAKKAIAVVEDEMLEWREDDGNGFNFIQRHLLCTDLVNKLLPQNRAGYVVHCHSHAVKDLEFDSLGSDDGVSLWRVICNLQGAEEVKKRFARKACKDLAEDIKWKHLEWNTREIWENVRVGLLSEAEDFLSLLSHSSYPFCLRQALRQTDDYAQYVAKTVTESIADDSLRWESLEDWEGIAVVPFFPKTVVAKLSRKSRLVGLLHAMRHDGDDAAEMVRCLGASLPRQSIRWGSDTWAGVHMENLIKVPELLRKLTLSSKGYALFYCMKSACMTKQLVRDFSAPIPDEALEWDVPEQWAGVHAELFEAFTITKLTIPARCCGLLFWLRMPHCGTDLIRRLTISLPDCSLKLQTAQHWQGILAINFCSVPEIIQKLSEDCETREAALRYALRAREATPKLVQTIAESLLPVGSLSWTNLSSDWIDVRVELLNPFVLQCLTDESRIACAFFALRAQETTTELMHTITGTIGPCMPLPEKCFTYIRSVEWEGVRISHMQTHDVVTRLTHQAAEAGLQYCLRQKETNTQLVGALLSALSVTSQLRWESREDWEGVRTKLIVPNIILKLTTRGQVQLTQYLMEHCPPSRRVVDRDFTFLYALLPDVDKFDVGTDRQNEMSESEFAEISKRWRSLQTLSGHCARLLREDPVTYSMWLTPAKKENNKLL